MDPFHADQRESGAPPVTVVRLAVPRYSPWLTYVFLGVNVLVWLAMTLAGGSEDPHVLLVFGAKFSPFIAAGQYWRLVTANFLHIGFLHLAFNSYALFLFGSEVERRFGPVRFLMLYMLSGIGGTVLSYVGSRALSAGASGAVFGLIGAMLAYYSAYREAFGTYGRRQLSSLLIVTGYNLLWGFINPGIDNLCHIGGLITGGVLGWAFCPRYQVLMLPEGGVCLQDRFSAVRASLAVLALGVVLGGLVYLGGFFHG